MEDISLASLDGLQLDATVEHVDVARPWALIVHGITATKDEGGMYTRLASRLAEAGYNSLRFSFRGHGKSGGTDRGVTIAGELLDLETALSYVLTKSQPGPKPVVIASSFGGVAVSLSMRDFDDRIGAYVLWNPVFDLRRTFLEPELPWQIKNFGSVAAERIRKLGYSEIDGYFKLGRVMYEEFALYDPLASFTRSSVPALIVHGDRDTSVSYQIAKDAAAKRGCELVTIEGSDHGFDGPGNEQQAIDATIAWLQQRGRSDL